MNTHPRRTTGRRNRLVPAVVAVAAVAGSLTLFVTSGGATSGGGPGGHSPVLSPTVRHHFEAPRGASDPVNPWTLNNPRYFAYLPAPVTDSAAPAKNLVIPDAERARLLALIEAGVSFTQDPKAAAPASDLVIPDAERARLLALIEAGAPLTAHPTTGGESGTGG